tara:strand:- start:949 stop:1287 length:339 start_codon:yes stop_codon:yes gene_type:complete
MKKITEISADSRQKLTLVGENNEQIKFTLEYKPTQQSWYFDIELDSFNVYGLKLVNSPNALRNYTNLIPFGISCIVSDGSDPYFVDDFTSGRCEIFLLTEEEVGIIEEEVYS